MVPAMTNPSPTTVSESIAAELRGALGKAEMSRRALAGKLGVDPMWVTRRLTGQTELSVQDVVRICGELNIDPMPLLEHALGEKATA